MLHVHGLSCNLIFMSQLIIEQKCVLQFADGLCVIQDYTNLLMVCVMQDYTLEDVDGVCEQQEGLYYFSDFFDRDCVQTCSLTPLGLSHRHVT